MPDNLSPIVLFAYDRPDHTRRALASLAANRLAGRSRLIVYCDGPQPDASDENLQRIEETRRIVRAAPGFGELIVHRAETNRGLMTSIREGVREVLDEYDRIIVLEDDLEFSPHFLDFMNAALDRYAAEESVMHISGYMFPVPASLPPIFFLKIISSWGWATWRRAFAHYEPDATRLQASIIEAGRVEEFNLEGSYNYMRQLRANAEGRLRSWAVKWYASVFLRGGLCLFPHHSLVRNCGHDGSGRNSARTRRFDVSGLAAGIDLTEIPLEENHQARQAVRHVLEPNLYQRMSSACRRGLLRAMTRMKPGV